MAAPEGESLLLTLNISRTNDSFSGKSSLLLTLLRILELRSGAIELDGTDISQVQLDLLRQQCFVTVSQDALMLSNETLRFNLDPEALLSDEIVIHALTKTKLWHQFVGGTETSIFTDHPILDRKLSSFSELSVGQCQLFALCRGLLKVHTLRNKGLKPIVLLDEVTSSLDIATESIIYDIVEEEFTAKGHTVIVVAHRLDVLTEHMREGRDTFVLMRDGRLEEIVSDLRSGALRELGEADT